MNARDYEIPMFSAQAAYDMGTGETVLLIVLIISFIRVGSRRGRMAVVAALAVCIIGYWCLSRLMKRCVWRLREDCIKQIGIGAGKRISYEEIAEALRTKEIKVKTTGFQVPKRRGYVTFYYEVGNSNLQKNIKESYRFLEEKVSAEFPKMTKTVIQQMDRSFFYRKERRNSSIAMFVSSISMAFCGSESMFGAVILVGLGQVIQYLMLGKLFKGIYFGKKTEQKIQETFEKYSNVKLRRVWNTYAQIAFTALLTAMLNLFWLTV